MSYDIYGGQLRHGHCEVHPHVHESYPCSLCISEAYQQEDVKRAEREYYRELEEQYWREYADSEWRGVAGDGI